MLFFEISLKPPSLTGRRCFTSFVSSQSARFVLVNYIDLETIQEYSRLSLGGSFLHDKLIESPVKFIFLEMNGFLGRRDTFKRKRMKNMVFENLNRDQFFVRE